MGAAGLCQAWVWLGEPLLLSWAYGCRYQRGRTELILLDGAWWSARLVENWWVPLFLDTKKCSRFGPGRGRLSGLPCGLAIGPGADRG